MAQTHTVTYDEVKHNEAIKEYIRKADEMLATIGFTEHSFAHVVKCADTAARILEQLGYDARTCELAKIAGYMHDIGNVVNRTEHAQSGAVMAFRILDNMGMDPGEIADIVNAIGNHDESASTPTTPIAAALVLADKTDVRRSRVRQREVENFDIHDRVNWAVTEAKLSIVDQTVCLNLKINSELCPVMDYFEIFLTRMLLCKKAATALDLTFSLTVNHLKFL